MIKIIETESRMVVSRGWEERGMGSYYLLGIEFQFFRIKCVLKMDSGDGSTTLLMYLISLKCIPKNGLRW